MFGTRFTLFKLLGFEVRIDTSWIIIALLIVWSLAQGSFPSTTALSHHQPTGFRGSGAIGLFGSIIFHELCHSLVARRFGLPMKGITLFIFGGVAEMDDEPASPRAEFRWPLPDPWQVSA